MSEHAIYVKDEYVPAKIWRRFVASIIDQAILTVLLIPISNLLGSFFGISNVQIEQGGALPHAVAMYLLFVIVGFLLLCYFYFTIFYLIKGATPGKLAMKIRVVALPEGGNVGLFRSFVREIIGKIVSSFFMVGYIIMILRKDHRALHDLISRTQVISNNGHNIM